MTPHIALWNPDFQDFDLRSIQGDASDWCSQKNIHFFGLDTMFIFSLPKMENYVQMVLKIDINIFSDWTAVENEV